MKKTKDFSEIIRGMMKNDSELRDAIESESLRADIAEKIFLARKSAGLTQEQLASLAGMKQSVIARLEDTDYDGHSVSTLLRIARALGKRLEIEFCDDDDAEVVQAIDYTFEPIPEWDESPILNWSSEIVVEQEAV